MISEINGEFQYPYRTTRDYLRVLFRRRRLMLGLVAVVVGTVALGFSFVTPVFEARVKMLISAKKQVDPTYYQELTGYAASSEKLPVTQSQIIQSSPVIERTVKSLKLHERTSMYEWRFASPLKKIFLTTAAWAASKMRDPNEQPSTQIKIREAVENLREKIMIEPIRDTNTFVIHVQDFDPEAAAVIANSISRSYVMFDLEQQLAEIRIKYGERYPNTARLKEQIREIEKTLDGAVIANVDAIGPASVKIIEQANAPFRPVGIQAGIALSAAFALSLFLGVILIFVFEYLDPTLKSAQEVERFLGLPVLGSIPKNGKRREIFLQRLADQLYFILRDKNIKTLMIAPAEDMGDSKRIAAEVGRRLEGKPNSKVLLIDADLRRPGLHLIFNIPDRPGLAEWLEGKRSLEQVIKKVENRLSVVPASETFFNPVSLLDSAPMKDLAKNTNETFDHVILVTSSLANFKDGAILSSRVDGTVVILDECRTRREVVKAGLASLEQNREKLLGVILNNRTFPIPDAVYNWF